jgi:hypothetical protein
MKKISSCVADCAAKKEEGTKATACHENCFKDIVPPEGTSNSPVKVNNNTKNDGKNGTDGNTKDAKGAASTMTLVVSAAVVAAVVQVSMNFL